MKLRLPHKFQAALMAALASVSFTTLSTGTLTVAAGAAFLAGQQAQAEAVQASETLNTVRALSNYTGKGFTLTEMTLTTSKTEGIVPTGGDFVSPEVNVGNGGTWTLQFTLTNTAEHAITLNSLGLDLIMYNSQGSTQSHGTYRSFAVTLSSGDNALGAWDGVLDASGNLTNAATIKGETGSPVVALANPLVLEGKGAVTLKLTAARGSDTAYQLGCFFGLKDMVVNYTYELTTIPTWNGKDGHANWSEAEAWTNGIPSSATPAVFDSGAAVRTVNIDTAATALSMTIDGAEYTFEGSGTLTVTGAVTVNSGLVLNSASAAQAMLPKVAGEGNVTLNAVLDLGSGFAPTGTGELTINSTRGSGAYDLKLQGGNSATHDFSTFSKLNLAEGVVIEYDAGNTTLNNVTLQGNASFNMYDMGVSGNGVWLKGATALGSHTLAFNNKSGNSWKRKVTIDQLTGDATSRLEFLGGATGDSVGSKLYINSLQGFSGTLHLEEKNTGNAVEATVKTGTGNAVKLAGVELAGTGELLDLTAQTALNLGTVSVANNSEIKFHGAPTQQITIEKLAGNNAAGKTLLLYSEDQTTNGDAHHIVLGAAAGVNYADNLYNGTLWVTSHSNQGGSARSTVDAYVAAQDVLAATTLKLENWGSAYNNTRISLSLGTDAKVAGIVGANTGYYAGWGAYIRSGQLTVAQPNGVADFVSTSETAYTLEITGAGTYASNAYIMGNVNLKMSGTGTQTFSGDVSRFNGSITTTAGTLAITNAITATELNGTGGTLQANGGLTVSGGSYAGTINTPTLTVNEGTLTLTGGGIAGATTVSGSGTLALNAQDTASVTLAHTITNAGTITLAGNATAGDPANYAVFKTGENTYSGQGAYAGSGYITGSSTQLYLIQHSGSGTFSGELTLTNADRITDGVDANDFVFQLKSGGPIDDVYHVNTAVAYSSDEMGGAGTILLHGPAGTLSLADNTTGALLGSKITGDGNVRISESFQLNGGSSGSVFTTSATGTLTVASGKTLTLGNSKDNAYLDFSSFTGVLLENNAQITLNQRPGMTFQNLSVAAGANAKFIGSDTYNELQNAGHLTGTTTINGSLIMSSGWKYQFTIDKLVGDGTLELQGNYEKHHLIIGGTEGTFGTVKWNAGGNSTEVKFTGNSTVTNLQNANNNGSADLTVNSGVTLDLLGNATNVNVVNNSGTISLHNGSTFTVFAKNSGQAEAMGNISVAGSATIVDTNFHATMNFTTITGGADATLTLLSSHSAQTSEWNLGVSGQTQANPFTGKLVLMAERDGNNNRAANFNFVDGTMFSGAEVQIKNGTEAGNTLTNTLKLKAASVTIGGLSDAAAGTVASDRIWSVANDSGQDYATLTLNGTGTYASDIKLGAGVNLAVVNTGTQTFSGDVSAFNGGITVSSGTLKITGANGITVGSLYGMSGTLDVAGTLTANIESSSPLAGTFDGPLALGGLVKTGAGTLTINNITRLGSTIQVNGGSLNVMDGTYELSGLTPTGGGTPVIPTEESGYADVSATVQFITTGEGGSFTKAESGLVFNYKGNTSNTLNNDGSVVFEGKDYTTYYLVGTEGNLDLTTEQGAHSMLQNVVLSGTAGTITVTDERSLTGSLTQADGSTLTVAGGGSLTVGSISNNAAIAFTENSSLTSTQAEMIVGAGKTFTTSGEGTLHMTGKTLHVNGNNAVATIGSDADLYQIRMGSGTVNLNGDVTMERLQLSVDNAASTVNIGAGATVHVTGTVLGDHTDSASFMVSNWNQLNTLNIEGHLITEASFSSRDGRADINVKDGGILEMHTGLDRNTTRGHDINVNVAGGGTLLTAGNSADRSEYGLHVNLADGSTLQGYYGTGNAITIAQALTLSGSSNTAEIEAADGKTLTVSGGISGNAGFTKTGTGTLVLSGNNTYTGGTVVSAGTLKAASANALGAGTLTLNAGSTLAVESGASANVLDVTVAGNATISNAGTLVFTGTGGINVAANATITMSGAGTYDLSAMDMEAGTGTVVYTGGAEGTTLNGFAKAAGTIDFIDITAENSHISYDGSASFTYKGANGTFNSSTGKVEVQAQDYDYSIFYVNEKADYVSNAKKSDVLNRIELASNVTLHVDGNNTIDVSLVQPQAGATGYTINVNSGSTLNITKTTDTSVITGAGTVYLSVGTEVIQGYAPTFKEGSPFTGTLVYHEGDIGNHDSYVTLNNTFQGTLELHGRMNGHAMNLGGATTLRLVGDRSDNVTGLWDQGAAMHITQALEVTGDYQVELYTANNQTTIIDGTVNSGTVKQGHLTKKNSNTMTFNGAVALAEFTNPGGTVNFNAGANIGTVNANGTINLNGAQAAYDLGDFKVAANATNVQLNVGAVASATAKSIFVGDAANLNLTLSQDMTVAAPSGSTTATDGAFYTMGANKTSNIKTADGVATKTLTVGKLDLANTGTGISLQNVNMVVNGEATVGVLVTDRGRDNATMTVGQGAALTLGGGVKWNRNDGVHTANDTVALVVNNGGTVNVNAGDANTLDVVTLNQGGALSFDTGTATTIEGTATISEVITNSGSLTFNGAIVIDGLDDAELSSYVDGQDSRNGFKRYSEGGTLTVVKLLGEGAFMTVKEGTAVTYKGHVGTLGNNGVFTIGETTDVDYSTFVVNSNSETPETYSHAKATGGETFTNVVLAAGTSFTIDAVGADFSMLDSVVVREGDTAATVSVEAPTNIGSVTTGAGLTFTGDSQSFTLGSVSGSGLLTINGPTVSIISDNSSFAGGITVNAGQLSVTNVNALGSGPLTANEGGTIQITTSTLPNTLTVGGQGDVNLLVSKNGQDVDLKTVSAANLHLLADSTHNSRFIYRNNTSNLNGVEHLYFDGGQLWLNNKDMTGADKFTGDVTFNTATVYSESTNIFDHAAMRIGMNADFAGTVDVKVDTRLGWGNAQDKTLEISHELVGSGALELQSYNNNTRGTLKISGDASNYQGATTSHSLITLQVAEGGKMNLATDSNLAGAVQLDAGGKMTVSGDSTITGAINGTGSLEVKENATLNYNRTAETTVAAQLSGEGTLQYTGTGTTKFTGDVSGFSGSVDVQAGELNIMNIAQATSLNVADVTIKNATLGVYSGATATVETASEGTLTIKNGSTLTASGENAKLNANLVMESGSTLDVSAYGGMGGLHMGSTITLTPGMTLSDNDMAGVSNLGFMDAYDLYFDVNEFFVGSTQYEEITFASEQWVKAADVFSNSEFASGKDYYVFYSGVNPGGNGGNVGTIYIVQVPEPTTSTLSLLALAALAARRRRK